jgi:hypothetical protein
MKHPIFYFALLKTWDIWTVFLYTVISICVFTTGVYTIGSANFKTVLFLYTFGTHFFLYLFNYRSLRNLTVYLIWILFGVIQLIAYFHLKDDSSLKMINGHAARGLRDTIILLIVFQVLRIISLNVQHQELVSPSRGGIDLYDERQVNWFDNLLFIVYMGCGVGLICF